MHKEAVVLGLDSPKVAVSDRVEADDLGEESGGVGVVDPLVLVDALRWGKHRRGQRHSVARKDAPAGLASFDGQNPRVLRTVRQRIGLEHLNVVELDEQGYETKDHEDPKSSNSPLHQDLF